VPPGGAECAEPVGAKKTVGDEQQGRPAAADHVERPGPVNRVLTGTSVAPADTAPNAPST
jgi:hypothetical protein